jgi:integrase
LECRFPQAPPAAGAKRTGWFAERPSGQLSAACFFQPFSDAAGLNDQHRQCVRVATLRQRINEVLTSRFRLIHRDQIPKRRSELLALRWQDFDEKAGTITVPGKIARISGEGLKRRDSGKTESSERTVPLPEFAITALAERRGRPFWGQHRMIFPSSAGTCCDPDNFNKQWRKVRGDLGVPDVTSHSFRKSVATMIDDAGLSARVGADPLGHAKVSMTQDRYMRQGKVHTEVAALLDRSIGGE